MISSGALTDPQGKAEGTADGCHGLSGGAVVTVLAYPAGQPFQGWGEWPQASVADGPALWEVPWWPGWCRARSPAPPSLAASCGVMALVLLAQLCLSSVCSGPGAQLGPWE